ncbi:ArsR/SmtB family transcription factor [Aurantiacibacter suaedae]|uniref:ArsR/SmtB family transcription factor n=1 Tax=Aurantiacibacter suaedae TaxID=2545755 RepID=UPI0010F749C4|nr:metalloregulator ArsR/SmtB family transcription factor [Aurantiacibacter suaedae]
MTEEELPVEELKAVAHPVRLKILKILCEGERNVGEIEEIGSIGQPSLSQQLAILRQAGLVTTRREGKMVFYGVERAAFRQILECLTKICVKDDEAAATRTPTPSPGAANFARLA